MNSTSTSSNGTSSRNGQNGHGGAREGAGRKPKALAYADTAALVEEKIAAALPDITDALIEAAKKGDLGAARYLCDRLLGRVATIEAPPAEDKRMPFTEEDASLAAAQQQNTRDLDRLIAGLAAKP